MGYRLTPFSHHRSYPCLGPECFDLVAYLTVDIAGAAAADNSEALAAVVAGSFAAALGIRPVVAHNRLAGLAHLVSRQAFAFRQQQFPWCIDLGLVGLAIYEYAASLRYTLGCLCAGIHQLSQLSD